MWMVWLLACSVSHHEIALRDLSRLGTEQLATLADEEHALSVARTQLAGAEHEAEQAESRKDSARWRRKQARLEYDVAVAELGAARASREAVRRAAAQARVDAASRLVLAEDARYDWQAALADAAEKASKLASAAVDLREAELQQARFLALDAAGNAQGYRRLDFKEAVETAQRRHDAARDAYDEAAADAERAWERWRSKVTT